MLKSEQSPDLRLELLRALGALGALDPMTQAQQVLQMQRDASKEPEAGNRSSAAAQVAASLPPSGAPNVPT